MEGGGADDKENAEARQQLLERLLSSGMLNSVKARLRAQLFAQLKGGSLANALAPAPSPTLQQHVLNCLVAEHLLVQQYRYTLSVFLAESGAHKLPQLSHADLLRLAGVVPGSRVHALLTARSAAGGGSLAAGMVEALGALESAAPTVSTGAQTEEQPAASAALLARLGAIEAEFAQRSAALEAASARSLEERMAEFQRSCEARYREQLAAEVARVREGEVAVVRETEAARHEQQLAAEREALQRGYQEQLDKLRTQETELLEKARAAQRDLDRLREEHAQRGRAEEERPRAWRTQEQAALAIKEAEARRRLEQLDRQERQALERQQEAEERLQAQRQAQQRDWQRHEEELRQQQAMLDLDRELLSRGRADLAAHAGELEQARRQLARLAQAHATEKASLQQELQALRQQLEQLDAAKQQGAAAAAEASRGQAGPAGGRLEKQLAQLQEELAVGRARERLWRESSNAHERLVDKASKWQEQCLRQVEELRLALGAAAREVADLQQRAQPLVASEPGSLGLALASAMTDAQQWREATASLLDQASQEEGRLRLELAKLQQRATAIRSTAAQSLQGLLVARAGGWRQREPAPALKAAAGAGGPAAEAAAAAAEEQQLVEEDAREEQQLPAAASLHNAAAEAEAADLEEAVDSHHAENSADEGGPSTEGSPSPSQSPNPSPGSASRTSHILAAYRERQKVRRELECGQAPAAVGAAPLAAVEEPAQAAVDSTIDGCSAEELSGNAATGGLQAEQQGTAADVGDGGQTWDAIYDYEDDCISTLSSDSSKF